MMRLSKYLNGVVFKVKMREDQNGDGPKTGTSVRVVKVYRNGV